MKNRIDVGDIVSVMYVDGWTLNCEVLNVPQQIGEMWVLKNTQWDELIYQNPASSNLDRIVLFKV